jgi:DNA-directed RNA polymerase subunit D
MMVLDDPVGEEEEESKSYGKVKRFLEIDILQKTDAKILFVLRGVHAAFANALRRIIVSEVPVMAIDDVVIIENSSSMYDEILAHRLGLIPIKTDLDSYVLPKDCACKSELGCPKCRVTLTLDVEATDGIRTVYSSELKSENPDVSPVSGDIPLLKLASDQKVKLECYAKLGIGKDYAKWQPISACTYRYYPRISVNAEICDACGKCVEACPKKILHVKDKKIQIENVLLCDMCGECIKECPKDKAGIDIKPEENVFIFYVESTGSLSPERLLTEAATILEKKSEGFIELLNQKESSAE